jgi:type III pantothenate kinase
MILIVDIGNTHIHLGLFIRGSLRKTWMLSSQPPRTHDEYALFLRELIGDGMPMSGAIVSSVVPRLEAPVARAIEQEFKTAPLVLDAGVPMGIVNGYELPSEVGMDRLANAVGACYFFGAPVMVLDFGTAITLDYLSAPIGREPLPVYLGGAILPGIELAAEAARRACRACRCSSRAASSAAPPPKAFRPAWPTALSARSRPWSSAPAKRSARRCAWWPPAATRST